MKPISLAVTFFLGALTLVSCVSQQPSGTSMMQHRNGMMGMLKVLP